MIVRRGVGDGGSGLGLGLLGRLVGRRRSSRLGFVDLYSGRGSCGCCGGSCGTCGAGSLGRRSDASAVNGSPAVFAGARQGFKVDATGRRVTRWMLNQGKARGATAVLGLRPRSERLQRSFHNSPSVRAPRTRPWIAQSRQQERGFRSFNAQRQTHSAALESLRDLKVRTLQNQNQIFISRSTDPYLNLSIEHYLLTHSDPESRILFLYGNRPCIVYGRNQNPWVELNLSGVVEGLPNLLDGTSADRSANDRHVGRATIPIDVIRRRSGGGTVFHDQGNLNYCVIVPNDKTFTRDTHAEMIVRGLQSIMRVDGGGFAGSEVKVNERHDVVMLPRNTAGSKEWKKVSGSAYKLTRGRALHHGTLLFESPYLGRISGLLRGLGKDLISMKGVGSVRSPVANLFFAAEQTNAQRSSATSTAAEITRHRQTLRKKLEQTIIEQWMALYPFASGMQATTPKISVLNLDVGEIKSSAPGASDGVDDPASAIAAGMKELRSLDWKYGQTPRFTFSSSQEGDDAPVSLCLEVSRGIIEKAVLEADGMAKTVAFDSSLDVRKQIWEIEDWKEWLSRLQREVRNKQTSGSAKILDAEEQVVVDQVLTDESILERLEECFPPVSKLE